MQKIMQELEHTQEQAMARIGELAAYVLDGNNKNMSVEAVCMETEDDGVRWHYRVTLGGVGEHPDLVEYIYLTDYTTDPESKLSVVTTDDAA